MAGYGAVSQPISARHSILLTNGRVTIGILLTYSCTLACHQAESLSCAHFHIFFTDITV